MKLHYTHTDKRNVAQEIADSLATQAGEGWKGKVCWNADVDGVWEITLIKETVRMMGPYPYAEQECRIAWVNLGFL
jgi:hypothetical protein